MSKVYSNRDMKSINLKRDLIILKPLLDNIKDEENKVYSKLIKDLDNLDIDFKKSFIMFSKGQVYKSYSTLGIMKYFDKSVKYFILDLNILLDIWYNNSILIDKSKLLNCDILIIHGVATKWQATNKSDALKELVSIRKTMNKLTWLYIEKTSKDDFEEIYPDVTTTLNKTYRSDF